MAGCTVAVAVVLVDGGGIGEVYVRGLKGGGFGGSSVSGVEWEGVRNFISERKDEKKEGSRTVLKKKVGGKGDTSSCGVQPL